MTYLLLICHQRKQRRDDGSDPAGPEHHWKVKPQRFTPPTGSDQDAINFCRNVRHNSELFLLWCALKNLLTTTDGFWTIKKLRPL